MKQEKQQEVALMGYGAIAPIIAGLDERYPSKTAFFAEISAKGLMGARWNCGRHQTGICAATNAPISTKSGVGIAVSVPVLRRLMAKNTGSISLH